MQNSVLIKSSIGKKLLMALTGLFLITFLVVHAGINSMIWFNDGGETFSHWGHFMGTNLIIRTMEIVLIIGFLVHIIDGLLLWKQNRDARPVKYMSRPDYAHYSGTLLFESKLVVYLLGVLGLFFTLLWFGFLVIKYVTPSGLHYFILVALFVIPVSMYRRVKSNNFKFLIKKSSWYSRSMGLLGTLILIFLVIHTAHFWIPNRLSQGINNWEHGEIDLYGKMVEIFQNPLIVLVYVAGCFSLFWHLLHGFKSAFQSLGLNNVKYNKAIEIAGTAFAIIVPLVFALMPISFYFHLVH